jgi:D-alanyl-D-alanine dipeptidase
MRIPKLGSIDGFRSVLIKDNGELLVSMLGKHPRIHIIPYHAKRGVYSAIEDIYVRKEVSEKLVKVAENLPQGIDLLLWDGWRPLSLQTELYNTYLECLIEKHPRLSLERLELLAEEHVVRPSRDLLSPSPYSTGGAVSVALCRETSEPLPFGSTFGDCTDKAHTRYYEETLADDHAFRLVELRRLLFNTMTQQGFTNYSNQWWHFDYGNQYWGKLSGQDAKYGYIDLT